jgi:NAD(P)-dependent dehydrogenase (short-subunit alcohol dehydrogenase family)
MTGQVAFVTGSSRGLGKGCALQLAKAGFDIVVAARTVHEGDAWEPYDPSRPLVGSLETTTKAVEATGQRVLPVKMDLLDQASLGLAVQRVLDEWGRIDVLVNNARHLAPGHRDRVENLSTWTIQESLQANVVNVVALTNLVIPNMLERGSGRIINITSSAAYMVPEAPVGEGGWSVTYAVMKGAFQRLAGMIAVELGPRGVLAFNVNPGYVLSERQAAIGRELGNKWDGAPPEGVATAIAWLASDPGAVQYNGMNIEGQEFVHERDLYPDWRDSDGYRQPVTTVPTIWS